MRSYILGMLILQFNFVLSQIVTIEVNSMVPCCSTIPASSPYIDSFDIDNDDTPEFIIQALFGGDDYGFQAKGINNTQLSEALPFGSNYLQKNWHDYALGMPHTVLFDWGDWWLPNAGIKYLGFRRINSIADTTYGWVKLDFRGEPEGYNDTVFILNLAYNLTPNDPLVAGETSPTSIVESNTNNLIEVYPNPFTSSLNVVNHSNARCTIHITDVNGKTVLNGSLKDTAELDLMDINKGIYFLNAYSIKCQRSFKVIKQ